VLCTYVNCEQPVPKDHPLRAILRIVDEALAALTLEFEGLYAKFGRPSIPPERLLRALLLQAFYSVRSERQLMASGLSRPSFPCGAVRESSTPWL
jgi:transposase